MQYGVKLIKMLRFSKGASKGSETHIVNEFFCSDILTFKVVKSF